MSKFALANGTSGLLLGGIAAVGAVLIALYASGSLFPSGKPVAQATEEVIAPVTDSATTPVREPETDVASVEPESEPSSEAADASTVSDDMPEEPAPEEPAALNDDPKDVAEGAPVVPDTPAPVAPAFDVVRVASDGQTLVAGSAPDARVVAILVDGVEAARTDVDGSGKFVTFLDLPASDLPRVVTLLSEGPLGAIESVDQVILAPVVRVAEAPEDTQSAEPQTEASPVETTANSQPEPDTQDVLAENAISSSSETAQQDTGAQSEVSAEDTSAETARLDDQDTDTAPENGEAQTAEVATVETEVATVETEVATVETEVVAAEEVSRPTEAEPQIEQSAPPSEPEVAVTAPDAPSAPSIEQSETGTASAFADAKDEPVETTLPTETAAATTAPAAAPEPEASQDSSAPEAPQAPAVILSTEAGLNVIQTGGDKPELLDQIALDAITYEDAGSVALTGRGVADEFVRIYLDNRPILTTEIGTDGQWRAELPEVETGTYTLRVDAVDEAGDVTSRVESPFRREDPVALAEAAGRAAGPSVIKVVTVQPGNTLWAIARDRYGEGLAYVKVFEANRDRIRDPDLIYPGQVFSIPE
ncbi:LysM peptidoglycan-binding domain-containing protein [Marivita sp. XM-24bin2]|jgi:nucleoid-associated protein YgaU|uniref:LysM peptidoglycan-binding domain-containing protein n=1 Tax=unclassified Marivita TaxID=2632480 RepID=UPI0025C1E728|nr:LysM peptidoglycan-binding domain-containing protein [Marivita sp. XM-24bin2]MCR9107425.1 LysM peptidoglycan-binding domain-containing protein [Paracoccaceae bacterium]